MGVTLCCTPHPTAFPFVGHEVSADISEGGMGSARRHLGFPENNFRSCSTRPARKQE
jgi:hypothetical protein